MARSRRAPATYARRGPQREPYDLVLIVCEGAKTEPYYFEGLKRVWRLSNANVHVRSAGASDPPNLVAYALEQLQGLCQSNRGRLRVARHARPQTAIYATSARHSANAAERLCL